ncbi:MAG: hypothetical protein JNK76_24830 [Planctomycetales bacterium]|nr:hypothetical protein [Planctomycetales bacterium]MBN8626181.1 hypothetical protein [Planctomycetota bacterium]
MSRLFVAALFVSSWLLAGAEQACAQAARDGYASPYTLELRFTPQQLLGDLQQGRGDPKLSSEVPYADWYGEAVKRRYTSWGPPARHYPAPQLPNRSADYLRQRVLAVALHYQGRGYQHHHLPDWDPPAGWPWKETAGGRNGQGVDCSNFTAFVYNLALGFKPTGAVGDQSEMKTVPGPGPGASRPVERIELPADRSAWPALLRPADLIFIRGKEDGPVTHVVLWTGEFGKFTDGSSPPQPLILDSTGEGRTDDRGQAIPDGVYLRPAGPTTWYARCASHALRIIPDDAPPAGKRPR